MKSRRKVRRTVQRPKLRYPSTERSLYVLLYTMDSDQDTGREGTRPS